MFPRFAVVLLAVVCAIGGGRAIPAYSPGGQDTCGANEEFEKCGSACAPTCANPISPVVCIKKCVTGCFCKQGFLRNQKAECVPAAQCTMEQESTTCPTNEEFKRCGSACAPTCANPIPTKPCNKNCCVTGCFCKEGFLRDTQGACVPAKHCIEDETLVQSELLPEPGPPQKCAPNEVFHPCGTACPPTCQNPSPSQLCTKQCVIGCFCKEGHLRNEKGLCVPASNCGTGGQAGQGSTNLTLTASIVHLDLPCPSDREVYSRCGSKQDCMASCDMAHPSPLHGHATLKCLQRMCTPGCVCKMPYFRHSNGQCVEANQCNASL